MDIMAGTRVRPAARVTVMPTASAQPVVRVMLNRETPRQRKATTTVTALARMTGPMRRMAVSMVLARSPCPSSSRKRETIKRQ